MKTKSPKQKNAPTNLSSHASPTPTTPRKSTGPLNLLIAGEKTVSDWNQLRPRLIEGSMIAWEDAYADFYLARLRTRYFEPIKILQAQLTGQGEGFSIVTIQCSLVEFLEATIQGITFKHPSKGKLGPHEYSASGQLFQSFLTKRDPFRPHFDTATAKAFYENIRCALLHEARTKDGWRIWAGKREGRLLDKEQKILFRDNLQTAFEQFLHGYRERLLRETKLQAAFIRKFDSLCND
jgi:hypothetical protein